MNQEQIKALAEMIADKMRITTKDVLTLEEVANYMGVSKSLIYKLTAKKEIPHYKSLTGGACYFNRAEVEQWLQSNPVATNQAINDRANQYCMKGGVK